MRQILTTTVLVLCFPIAATGQSPFGDWMIFPGPNPGVSDLLPDDDTGDAFRIGQILFDYQTASESLSDQQVEELNQLQTVAKVVKLATPNRAMHALVRQQLVVPHRFEFQSATVSPSNGTGFVWDIDYSLFPESGGGVGVPFRYRVCLDGRGQVIKPRMHVFDAYYNFTTRDWTCSVLCLDGLGIRGTQHLSKAEIHKRAIESLARLQDQTQRDDRRDVQLSFVFQSQQLVRIPISVDDQGTIGYRECWAVNFRDVARRERDENLFTIWVDRDGTVSKLRQIDLWAVANGVRVNPKVPSGSK